MKIKVIETTGLSAAIMGLGLSYGLTSDMDMEEFLYTNYDKCRDIANKLAHKQGGHNKFLESITISLDITAPRYWWSEFDTYRVGVTKQSESTMHTITKRPLTQKDFQGTVVAETLTFLNELIDRYNNTPYLVTQQTLLHKIKNNLPEGFLQRRIVVLNAKTLQNIIAQRHNHRLREWHTFCTAIYNVFDEFPFPGNPLPTWIFPEGYTPPQENDTDESDTPCEEHSS